MMKRLCATVLLLAWGLCALAVEKSATIVYINGSKYYVHTVLPGETLYALSKAYGVGEQVIVENNPAVAGGLKAAQQVRIPFIAQVTETVSDKKLRKTFDTHFVAKGETLYGLSRRYQIPIQTIIEDNPNLDPVNMRQGERLLIRKKSIGSEDEAGSREQWEAYRETLNSVAEPGSSYHIVQPGETFYSLSHRFGITEEQLSALNGGLRAQDLRAGAMLKVPGTSTAAGPATTTSPQQPVVEQLVETPAPRIDFRALPQGETLDVALMLPMAVGGDANGNYLEFYQGFRMGLDSIAAQSGHSVHLTLYNTGRDPAKIEQIVRSADFAQTKLIVGPVYEEGLAPVLRFAEENHVPVVSPLANIATANSSALFQLAPDPLTKYAKVADLLGRDKRITLIYASSTDKEFEREILAALGNSEYTKYNYRYVHPSSGRSATGSPSDLQPLLDNDQDNVFIVMADSEVDVDRILAAIASADTSITSRGRTAPRFVVLGNARWNRYNNLDRTMFFKDRVVFISTYHAKRDFQAVVDFDSAYIRAFGSLPTLYSYRGYDAAMLFVPAMWGDIQYNLEGRTYTPLQTTYLFQRQEGRDNHVNRNWMRVNYNTDFTITTE